MSKKLCGKEDRWPEYRLAGRLWLESCLSDGVDPTKLIKTVRKLQDRCVYYLNNRNNWPN
ncbi:hypothetical protein C4577_03620 [Candidatus Parcubacteria bacterium]|nr:MAG: hypothetical protein C4577_03620 [Candidatus Parcubacteria bacterium]